MELLSREDQVATAGEYVLGLLSAEERTAFEQALVGNDALRVELRWWEQRLSLLGLRLKPVAPRPMVWLDVRQQMQTRVTSMAAKRPTRVATAWMWFATAASLVLSVLLVQQMIAPPPAPTVITQKVPVPVPAVSFLALLEVPKSTMRWSISVTPATQQMVVRAVGDVPPAVAQHDAELWLITAAGPVSMGVIPKTGELRRPYPRNLKLGSGATLAVSLEPLGGSPTGQPTGPVVTTATILQAG